MYFVLSLSQRTSCRIPPPPPRVGPMTIRSWHGCSFPLQTLHPFDPRSLYVTSVFWPRVRARALRAPVFLGSLTRQKGRCAPPPVHRSFAASSSSKIKISYFPKQNASLQAQTRAARDVYLSTGLSCTLLSYMALY
jgi:hypothetical protein